MLLSLLLLLLSKKENRILKKMTKRPAHSLNQPLVTFTMMVARMKKTIVSSLALTLSVGMLLAAAPAQAALVGLYQFNDASNLGLDSSGNGNNLVVVGSGVSYTANGAEGGGAKFTGSGDLTTSNGKTPVGTPLGNASYTLSVTFSTTSHSNYLGLIGWGNYGSSNRVNALRLANHGSNGLSGPGLRAYWWSNDLDAAVTTNDGTFHTVQETYDGTTRKLYFDGSMVGSRTSGSDNSTNINFAVGLTNFNEYFSGTLDNVAIFDTALGTSALQTIAAGNFASYGVAQAGGGSSGGGSGIPEPGVMGVLCTVGLLALTQRRIRRKAALMA